MTFGTKLRKYREKKRLSQREVADIIGVSQSTYSNWESDIRGFRVEYLTKLALLFDLNISDLLGEERNIDRNCSQRSVYKNMTIEDGRELLADLLESKDEIIRLLREENAQLKNRNAQSEDKENI